MWEYSLLANQWGTCTKNARRALLEGRSSLKLDRCLSYLDKNNSSIGKARAASCFVLFSPAIQCFPFATPKNGTLVRSSRGVFGITEFACDEGYALKGQRSSVCREDGTWSSTAPSCEGEIVVFLVKPKLSHPKHTIPSPVSYPIRETKFGRHVSYFKGACLRIPKYMCKWIFPISLKFCRYVSLWGVDRLCKALEKVSEGNLETCIPLKNGRNITLFMGLQTSHATDNFWCDR